MRALVAAAVVGALACVPALPASAHAYLTSSTPKDGATVAGSLTRVDLTFDESLIDLHSNEVAVTDAQGRHYERACPTVRGATVSTPVALGPAGAYRATWRVVSADGHVVSDSISFTTSSAGTGSGSTDGSAYGSGLSGGQRASTGLAPAVVIAIVASGVAVLAVLALLAVVVIRLRRPAPSMDSPQDPAESSDG